MAIDIPEENTLSPLTVGTLRRIIAWCDDETEIPLARETLGELIDANAWSLVPDTEELENVDGRYLVACRAMVP